MSKEKRQRPFRGMVNAAILKKAEHVLLDKDISNTKALRAYAAALADGDERALEILDDYAEDEAGTDAAR